MELNSLPEITTPKELADYLRVNVLTVKRALKSGELVGFKAGRAWRIEKHEVISWLSKE